MRLKILFALMAMLLLPIVNAVELGGNITAEEQETLNQIIQPISKVYTLLKYIASAVAVIVLLWAGISYMINSDNPLKRENSKQIITYTVIGLIIIWAAQLIVNFIIG